MRKSLYIVLILLMLTGCASLKQGWRNFKAYYNTYHNAKEFYQEGVEKNRAQLPDLNPNKPIRIYQQPTGAGMEDFQKAIEKGESILRNHNESKYIIPSLFIIGKSHYYRSEFFAALEQFQNIANATEGRDRQQALIWQGITYYDLGTYSEGIEVMLYGMGGDMQWDQHLLAQARAATAQLQAASQNYVNASGYLEMALPDLNDQELKARAYFLLGQMYEERGMIREALFAYSQIADIRTSFDTEFNALRKQAEMLRATGDFEGAATLYRSMLRDDKYIEHHSELQFEIAKTHQASGNTNEAISGYRNVLSNPLQPPNAATRAKTYYNLGELFRDSRGDFIMAAAYFDSAASENADRESLPDDFRADELAGSFGEYVMVKRQIMEKDSLLNLAEMDEEERRNFLAEIRRERIRQAEEELEQLQAQQNQMLVAEPDPDLADAALDTEDGFLNIKNPARMADASLRFQAIWGDRPLADNWRRRADVSGSRFDNVQQEPVEGELVETALAERTGINPVIDLSEIPFSAEEQERTRAEIEQLNYQLANVFFLSMDMPDSASVYFQKVLESGSDSLLAVKSIYSLAEMELEKGDREGAMKWYRQLQKRDGGSGFTKQLAEQLDLDSEERNQEGNGAHNATTALPVLSEENAVRRAERLREAAYETPEESLRPILLYDASSAYMQAARSQTDESAIRRWFQEQDSIRSLRMHWDALKDSAEVMLNDTTLSDSELSYWTQISDSTFTEPGIRQEFPFRGAYWDSTRALLNRIENDYPTTGYSSQVRTLLETLAVPGADSTIHQNTTGPESEEIEYPACSELGVEPVYEGGLAAFMSSLEYPSWTENVTIRGELEYLLTISADGEPSDLRQMSNMDRSGIPQSVEQGIREKLIFLNPAGERVRCRFTFPINL